MFPQPGLVVIQGDQIVAAAFNNGSGGFLLAMQRVGGIERSEMDRSERDVPRRGTAGGRDQITALSNEGWTLSSNSRATGISQSSLAP
jgi:hypothetical protein